MITHKDVEEFNAIGNNSEAQKMTALKFYVREATLLGERDKAIARTPPSDLADVQSIMATRELVVEDTWKDVCRICRNRAVKGDRLHWRKGLGWVHTVCGETVVAQ